MRKGVLISIMVLLGLIGLPSHAIAADQNIIITEVQTGSASSASDEFVEVYNNSNSDIDLAGWSLYYRSATGTSWTKKATVVTGTIKSKSFWTFASVIIADIKFSSGLSSSGGAIEIRDKAGLQVDQFGWGSSQTYRGSPASPSASGQSMYRIYDFTTSSFVSAGNNFADFDLTDTPTPSKLPEPEKIEQDTEPIKYPQLELSEIFPDPASPQTDSEDEFIEIFNPTDTEADLSGWKLVDEAGNEFLIKDYMLEPLQRISFYPTETKITLNNTGDSIKLINPNGEVADESDNYGSAKEGLSWSKIGGIWQWAEEPTADAANADAYIADVASGTSAVAKVKKSATKKTTTKKASSAKSSQPASSKLKAASKSTNNLVKPEDQPAQKSSGLWGWLIAAVGIATIGYAIYEYRTEIQLFFKKLRGHR